MNADTQCAHQITTDMEFEKGAMSQSSQKSS